MRQQDPNDLPHIGGQGLGIQTLQYYLRDSESDVFRIYDRLCRSSSTEHVFPARGKQLYLDVAAMHASHLMVSTRAQQTRINRLISAFGMSLSGTNKSRIPVDTLSENASARKLGFEAQALLRQDGMCQMNENSAMPTATNSNDIPQPVAWNSHPHLPISEEPAALQKANVSSQQHVGTPEKPRDPDTELPRFIALQEARRMMTRSRDDALSSAAILAREPIIRGRLKTLEDHMKVWILGVYREVPIRKLRRVEYRKQAHPPITNTEWRTEKHSVRRLFEGVNIVSHFLPGKQPDENIPRELWDTAVEEAYRTLGAKRGRKTSISELKSAAQAKGITFKCEDPRIEAGQKTI